MLQCKLHVLWSLNFLTIVLISLPHIETASIKDILKLNADEIPSRVPRDNKYYPTTNRYRPGPSNVSPLNRPIKPEDPPESQEAPQTPVEKRCTRCDSDGRSRYDYGRYRDRFYDDDKRYDRYDDRRYDRYDDRDRNYERRPPPNDRYYDRYNDRYNDDRDRYDRYDRDRYERYGDRDRYDRYGDRDVYNRDYDRGYGYDNRGYDYKDRGYDYKDRYEGYRPWDETYRGSSGWDSNGRGYYFATGRPEVGAGGYWGTGGGYASSWNYGNRDPDRGNGSNYNRPRDPYEGYRGTSYLYGRPSSTTTDNPSNSNVNDGVTQNPQQDNTSG